MRKLRRTPTGTGRKGHKLKGLTSKEAHDRTVKGWRTKRAKGLFAARHHLGVGSRIDVDEHDPTWTSEKRRRNPIRDMHEAVAEQSGLDAKSLKEQLDWEAREFARTGVISKDWADTLEGAPGWARDEFYSRVRAEEVRQQRHKMMDADQDSYTLPAKGNPGETTEKQARNRLHGLINKDPRAPAGTRTRFIKDEDFAETVIVDGERVKNPVPIHEPVTENRIRAEAQRALNESFKLNDPIHGRETRLVMQGQLDQLEDYIVRSYFGPTEFDRAAATMKAERLAAQMAQRAGRKHEARATAARDLGIEEKVNKATSRTSRRITNAFDYQQQGMSDPAEVAYTRNLAEGELAKLRERSKTVQELEKRRVELVNEERRVRENRPTPTYLYNEDGSTRRKRMPPALNPTARKRRLREIKREREKIEQEVNDYNQSVKKLEHLTWETQEQRARRLTERGLNQFTENPLPTEKRLGGTVSGTPTVEEYYKRFGHEDKPDHFARIKFENSKRTRIHELEAEMNEKLKGAHSRARRGQIKKEYLNKVADVRSQEPPQTFARLRAHRAFTKDQAAKKTKAFQDGTFTGAWNAKGERVAPGDDAAVLRISPNKKWVYQLRDEQVVFDREGNVISRDVGSKREELPYWDTKTRHEMGRRNRFGQLLPDQYDEVQSEKEESRFQNAVNISRGSRKRLGQKDDSVPEHVLKAANIDADKVSKEEFIAMRGVKQSHKRVDDPDNRYPVKQVRANGRWVEASDIEYDLADKGARRIDRFPKQKIVTFIDPKELELSKKQRDEISLKIPAIRRKQDAVIDNGWLSGGHKQRRAWWEQDERILDINVAGSETTSRAVHAFGDARRERELREASAENAWREAHYTGKIKASERGTAAEIAAAGGFAAWYGSRERVKKGYAPRFFNERYKNFYERSPKYRRFASKHGFKPENVARDFEEAYVRPGVANTANFWWRLKHPLSSPEGTTLGVDWGKIRYRDVAISPEKKAFRDIQRLEEQIERVARTEEFIGKNAYRPGLRGAIARHRTEPLKRWKDYTEFHQRGGLLEEGLRKSRETTSVMGSETEAFKKAAELEQRIYKLRAENVAKSSKSTDLVPYIPQPKFDYSRFDRWAKGDVTNLERNVMIGGAVAGTALGAHYLYHRHQERKRRHEDPEYQGTRYYNKLIPGPIRGPVPKSRATGHYRIPTNKFTYEFGFANKRVPVRWGVSTQNKTLWKGSPADRGYDPNLKVVGRTKLRRPTRGGSFVNSLFFDTEAIGRRKRSHVPKGAELKIAGRSTGIRGEIGARKKLQLTRTNPNRMSVEDRENLAWAVHSGGFGDLRHISEDERLVRSFFPEDDRIQDLLSDDKEMRRIRKRKGEKDITRTAQTSYKAKSYVGQADDSEDITKFDPDRTAARGHNVADMMVHGSLQHQLFMQGRGGLATGGTGGVDPYSQIGHRRVKYETDFDDQGKPFLRERPIGTRRVNPDAFNYVFPTEHRKPPGRKKK